MARISIVDAYQRLGISRAMLYLHIKSGKLTTFKDGARTFVHEDGLLALERGARPAPAEIEEEPPQRPLTAAEVAEIDGAWKAAIVDQQADAAAARAADIEAIAQAVAKRLKGN